jgi:hypothetical protein
MSPARQSTLHCPTSGQCLMCDGEQDHEGVGPWAVESVAGLLTRASGELVERLRGVQQAGRSSKRVAIDKADDTTMR